MSLLTVVAGRAVGLAANVAGPWRLWAELALAGVLVSATGAQTWRLHTSQADAATAKAATALVAQKWAEQVAAGTRAAFEASEKNRALEAQFTRQAQEAKDARDHDLQANARVVAGLATQRDELRNKLTAFARGGSGGGGLTDDTVAAARARAEALGDVLAEALRAEEDATADAEDAAADARSLYDGWKRISASANAVSHGDRP